MQLINLPRLRTLELQTLAENSIKLCHNIEEVKLALTNVQSALSAFKQGMLKDKSTGASKHTLDKIRDNIISGFIHVVKAEKYFPHEDENIAKVIFNLTTILAKYGSEIIHLPMNKETDAIDNMLAEIKKVEDFELLDNSLIRWIPAIESANEEFKSVSNENINSVTNPSEMDSTTKLTPYLEEALEGLYTLLYAHVKITNDNNIKNIYSQITSMVDALR